MKRKGQISYELTEEEYNRIKSAVQDIHWYFNREDDDEYYKKQAINGAEVLNNIFEEEREDW